ncbi:MAG TPA: YceI family protein [Thermoanaerobaculia bacterium]|jgi:polyisoprenoid-binding protein YceI
MKRSILSALALLVFLLGVAAADRYSPGSGSFVRIEGTSSLHDWKMEGSTILGSIAAPPIEQWTNGTAHSEVSVSIPVTSIKSEHAKMDKLMAEALKADANPAIRYELTSATLASRDANPLLSTRGKLTIAGVTREVEMQIAATRQPGNAYVLTGRVPIRMSDYGIKPPTAMLGTIKTGNDVTVTFRWVVETAN